MTGPRSVVTVARNKSGTLSGPASFAKFGNISSTAGCLPSFTSLLISMRSFFATASADLSFAAAHIRQNSG